MKEPAFVIFLFLFSLGQLVFGSQPSSTDNNSETCQTPACLEIASRLLHKMDVNVDPCEDFYQFTCGGYINSTYLPHDWGLKNSFTVLQEQFYKTLQTTLEQNSSINEFEYLKIAKNIYKLCSIDKSYKNILHYLENYGGWPVLKGSKWSESKFHLDDFSRNADLFIKLFHIDNFSISMEPLLFTLTVQDLAEGRNNTKVNEYYNDMIKAAENMGVKNNANYKDELDKILEFEIELSRGKILAQKKLDPTFDRVEMTLDELTKNYSFFNWQTITNFTSHPQVNLSSTFTITNFSYLKKLSESLNLTEIKRILTNYMMWKYVEREKNTPNFTKKGYDCLRVVISRLPTATATIYVQSYNNNSMMINAMNDALKMYMNIKKKFHRMIEEADWIDNHTKNTSIQKLKFIKIISAYIAVWSNTSLVDTHYKNLHLFGNESYSDIIAKLRSYEYFINNMYDPIAALHSTRNIVISYLVIPQSDYYNYEAPNYINYGGLGFVMSHELLHAYDIEGINDDSNTGRINYSLWTEFSRNNFHNRSQCIIEQYGNYTEPEFGRNLDGSASQRETISDNGGMRATYRAYEELSNSDKRLPGLDYSPKQLFWISYGNAWCEKTNLKHIGRSIQGQHPLNKFRVRNTLSNMPEFSKDFGCPRGSNMNPIKKCTVW